MRRYTHKDRMAGSDFSSIPESPIFSGNGRTQSLSQRCAERLRRFIRNDFHPASDASWNVAEHLWHAAYWTRLARRERFEIHHEPPPIPQRRFDWHATERDYDLGRPMGFGPTPQDAIADLVEQLP